MRNYTIQTVNEPHVIYNVGRIERLHGMIYFFRSAAGSDHLPELILPEQEVISVIAHQEPAHQPFTNTAQPF